jgi:hypothetical protein
MTAGLRVEPTGGGDGGELHMFDTSTGQMAQVPPAGRHGLRMRVHLACPGGRVAWTQVRVLVVADVLLRALETTGVQVLPALAVPDLPSDQAKVLDRALARYGVRLPEVDDDSRADLHLHTDPEQVRAGPGIRVRVGEVATGVGVPDPLSFGPGEDPLARRLALLSGAYREPMPLDAPGLQGAAARLAGWRTLVRAWSREPSGPVPAALREQARQTLDSDLDTPHLLGLLDKTADAPALTGGARFESFVWLDMFLGLDLARDLAVLS